MPRPPVRAQRRGRPGGSPRNGRRQQQQQQQQQQRGRQSSDNNTRDQLARKLADKPVGTRPEDSDDSDRLVTKGRGGSGRRGRSNARQEIYASGGVGAGDKPGAHPTRAQRLRSMAKALNSPRPRSVSASARQPVGGLVNAPPSEPATTNGVVTTPSRDASILDGFKPRKRQLSLLRTTALDSSTLDLSNDSFALPDDESTPAQVPAPARPVVEATPMPMPTHTPLSSDSATRKRKLGSEDPPPSASRQSSTPSLVPDSPTSTHTPPSSHKRRRRTLEADNLDNLDNDDQDIMAPPLSSSSSSATSSPPPQSPARPISSKSLRPLSTSTRTQATTTTRATTTQQLQSLMPSKRHRARATRVKASEFDIPSDDASSEPAGEPDDASFLPPTTLKLRSSKRASKNPLSKTKSKPKPKSKSKSERPLQPSTRASRTSTTATTAISSVPPQHQHQRSPFLGVREQPDASPRAPGRSSVSPRRGGTVSSSRGGGGGGGITEAKTKAKAKHSGGSRRPQRLGGGGGGTTSRINKDFIDDSCDNTAAAATAAVAVTLADKENTPLETLPKKRSSKWDEIDAFDLEFEDVSVYDRSSEQDAR